MNDDGSKLLKHIICVCVSSTLCGKQHCLANSKTTVFFGNILKCNVMVYITYFVLH